MKEQDLLELTYKNKCKIKFLIEIYIYIYIYGNPTVPFLFFFFFLGTLLFNRQPAISSYQNITFDSTILTLCNINITCDCTFFTFGGSLIFSHI